MKLILITSPGHLDNEAEILNSMPLEKVWKLHLRKENMMASDQEKFILNLQPALRTKLVLHGHYHQATKFRLGGIHVKREMRGIALPEGMSRSASVHHPEEAEAMTDMDYLFAGPVFSSISKPGYGPSPVNFGMTSKKIPPLIALGGINENNIADLDRAVFSGCAVLGAVWNSDSPASALQRIVQAILPL